MCGIAGIVWSDCNRRTPTGWIERMTDAIAHRGPDGSGYYENNGVSLGHRRLSIIDTEGGAQPMSNRDQSVWVSFNGEIYNYKTIAKDLEKRGYQFHTHCDTEVLIYLYEEYGTKMFRHLRGMFTFAIWDDRNKKLVFARDRMGQKPLVYRLTGESLVLSSELKSLCTMEDFQRTVDPTAIDDYLAYQYIPHPKTIYQGVNKLPPAHYGVYEKGRLTIEPYWTLPTSEDTGITYEDASHKLRETLDESVRLRLMSDVPLGAFLSGGIDSTIIVGLMAQHSSDPVKTFSIGFPISEYDESEYARQAADRFNTDHRTLIVQPNALEIVPLLAQYYDEPFADSSAIPTYYVSKLTREHVTVALSGDAGDELFAGYLRYRAVRIAEWYERMPKAMQSAITSNLWQLLPSSGRQKSRLRKLKKLLATLGRSVNDLYRQFVSIFDDDLRSSIYTNQFREQLNDRRAADWLDRTFELFRERDFVTRSTLTDVLTYLPCDLLTKVDIASMANSLECRGPFLDHHVVELAASLPISMKLKGKTDKYILKNTFRDLLPPSIQKRGKMGFGVPLDHWFRSDLKEMLNDTLTSSGFKNRGWFDSKAIQSLIEQHQSGKWDHSARLWALLMLELWAQVYLDR